MSAAQSYGVVAFDWGLFGSAFLSYLLSFWEFMAGGVVLYLFVDLMN